MSPNGDPDWVDEILAHAARALSARGVRRWEIAADEVHSAAVEASDQAVQLIERSIERSLGIRVLDRGIGFAGLSEPREAADIEDAIEVALDEARRARPAAIDDFAGPIEAKKSGADFIDPRAIAEAGPRLADRALALEAAALKAHAKIARIRPARVDETRGRIRIRTSLGLDAEEAFSHAEAYLVAVAEDEDDAQSAEAYGWALSVEGLDLVALAEHAAWTSAELLGAGTFETRRVPVILSPEAVASLAGILVGALDADAIDRGASFLRRAIGEEVLSRSLTILDQPHDPALAGASWFDGEGLPTAPKKLFDRGMLATVLDDRETAARAGRAFNAQAVRQGASGRPSPGAHSIVVRPGTDPLAALLRKAEGGLYVHEVSGTHTINEVTGELSLGAKGWAIRGGARAEPIEGVTIAGGLLTLLAGDIGLSTETRRFGAIEVPALFLDAIQVAG